MYDCVLTIVLLAQRGPKRPEDSVGSPGAGVAGRVVSHRVGAGN